MNHVFTPHALEEIRRRGLADAMVASTLSAPMQRLPVRPGRVVLQSLVQESGKIWLVRVIVDVDRVPNEVVTAYRTSKIDKYWRVP